MNKKLVLTAILLVVLVSTGTYVGLNTLWPFQPETIKVGETAELTDVLAAELKPAAPSGTPTIIGTTEEIKEAPAPEAAAEAPAAEERLRPQPLRNPRQNRRRQRLRPSRHRRPRRLSPRRPPSPRRRQRRLRSPRMPLRQPRRLRSRRPPPR
jgi:hypothetical protein